MRVAAAIPPRFRAASVFLPIISIDYGSSSVLDPTPKRRTSWLPSSKRGTSAATRAELLACARRQGSYALLQAIKEAIDDYAECEIGHREYFWGRPHSAGW